MFHLLPYLTVWENVMVAAQPGTRSEAESRATEMLEQFGMIDRVTHLPSQLSVGQRQRVAVARALLNRPRLLLADEPTGNLDPDNANSLLDILSEYHRDGGTILLVTHDARAGDRANRVVHMDSGKIAEPAAGPFRELDVSFSVQASGGHDVRQLVVVRPWRRFFSRKHHQRSSIRAGTALA